MNKLLLFLSVLIFPVLAFAGNNYNTLDTPPPVSGTASITGGTINGTTIGNSSAAPGTFATVGTGNLGLTIESYAGSPTNYGAIYLSNVTPGATNYSLAVQASTISINAPTNGSLVIGGSTVPLTWSSSAVTLAVPFILPGGNLLSTSAALTNGAASAAATLSNAPVSGNPTKWIPISDNGTTRYIPAW